jgi:NAD(P)-dependent dehydrogenase (short-subunit alcohol dehydrogenase family)
LPPKRPRPGRRGLALPVDVRSSDASTHSFEATDAFGRIDGAVNNAGIDTAPMHDLTDADYAEIMDVNARGVFFAMRAEIAAMGAAGGAIVNVGSVARSPGSGQSVYAASKHAVWALTRSAAVRFGRGIRINMIAPLADPRCFTACYRAILEAMRARQGCIRSAGSARPKRAPRRSSVALRASSIVCGQSIGVDGGYSATLG